jgi:hypothetical protein
VVANESFYSLFWDIRSLLFPCLFWFQVLFTSRGRNITPYHLFANHFVAMATHQQTPAVGVTLHNTSSTNSVSDAADAEKNGVQHIEAVRTISRVPDNPNYYEKDGLRTYGDDEDHEHEPEVRIKLFSSTHT